MVCSLQISAVEFGDNLHFGIDCLKKQHLFGIITVGGGIMRFAVVDDESAVLEHLPVQLASLLPDDTVTTDCFHNAQEFISAYHHTRYDALFLDIDMPDMNGFELS